MIQLNDLFDYKNRFIYQDSEAFKFSIDSILLSEYVKKDDSIKNILDLCTGNAAVLLILSTYTNCEMVGFEVQKKIYDLAIKSVKHNKLNNQIRVINDDVNNLCNYYNPESFDVITCNPPYFKVGNEKVLNKNDILSIARHELKINLEQIFLLAQKFLVNKGKMYIINRAERLDELFVLANQYKLPIKELQLIQTKITSKPSLVIAKCIKNGKTGVKINKILNIQNLTTYQNIFMEGK